MKSKPYRIALSALLLLSFFLSPLAQAQWVWKDKNGRQVFSDQPPPADVPNKDIVRRPASASPAAPADVNDTSASTPASATSTAATTATAPKLSGKDAELEKKKKEAEAKVEAEKKAEAQKQAEVRKDNCERAKRAKASFDSGQRLSSVNAQGEREVMSDAARAAEVKRLQDIMTSDCK